MCDRYVTCLCVYSIIRDNISSSYSLNDNRHHLVILSLWFSTFARVPNNDQIRSVWQKTTKISTPKFSTHLILTFVVEPTLIKSLLRMIVWTQRNMNFYLWWPSTLVIEISSDFQAFDHHKPLEARNYLNLANILR